jgi:hypothetical protein
MRKLMAAFLVGAALTFVGTSAAEARPWYGWRGGWYGRRYGWEWGYRPYWTGYYYAPYYYGYQAYSSNLTTHTIGIAICTITRDSGLGPGTADP